MRLHNKHIDIILLGLITLFLSSCSQSRSLDEQAVLAQSSFYDGEVAATVANAEQAVSLSESQTSGDSGFIPDPDDPNGDPDGGVIPPGDDDPDSPPTPPVADNDPPVPMPDDPPGGDTDPPGDDPDAPPTPPVADNDPPAPMPDDPPGDDGGIPPVADNDPPDGGVIPPGDDPTDPPDGGDIPPDPGCQELVEFKLTRVCSERRSKLSSFLFFEEALHPIMTVTAYVDDAKLDDQLMVAKRGNAKKRKRWLSKWFSRYSKRRARYRQASFGMGSMPTDQVTRITEKVLNVIDLSQVDLYAGPYSGSMVIDLTSLKAEFPRKWRKIPIKIAVCNDSNGDNSCENEVQNSLHMHEHMFNAGHIPSRLEIPVWHGRNKNSHNHPDFCEKQYSPLVLDIKGNGFRMSAAEESGVYFDLNNTGRPVYTGWVASSDDVFLVRDLNGNGRIDNGGELFGSATLLPNGERAENGFEALKPLDSNGDGYITRQDAEYGNLRLWRDKNFDGYTDRGEMYRLRQARVASINLNYVEIMEVDPHGNETRQRSTFTKVSRGKRLLQQIVDIWFRTIGTY